MNSGDEKGSDNRKRGKNGFGEENLNVDNCKSLGKDFRSSRPYFKLFIPKSFRLRTHISVNLCAVSLKLDTLLELTKLSSICL